MKIRQKNLGTPLSFFFNPKFQRFSHGRTLRNGLREMGLSPANRSICRSKSAHVMQLFIFISP
jgi:hypothetical protein